MATCTGCGREYAGVGRLCGACRRTRSRRSSLALHGYHPVGGTDNRSEYGDTSSVQENSVYEAEDPDALDRWKEAARKQLTGAANNGLELAAGGGVATSWSFGEWLLSLSGGFGRDLADGLAKVVCPEGKYDDTFLLSFLRAMPQEDGTLLVIEDLLRRSGALTALANAFLAGGRELQEAGAATSRELSDKFVAESDGDFELAFGAAPDDFSAGLEALIGPPSPKLREAMEREHCAMADSDVEFETRSYGIRTTPRAEWAFVMSAEAPQVWPAETKNCDDGHRRQPRPFAWLLSEVGQINAKLREHRQAELLVEEAVAMRLYTGPMSQAYNTVLRAAALDRRWVEAQEEVDSLAPHVAGVSTEEREEYERKQELLVRLDEGRKRFDAVLRSGNMYPTTIHVLNSALVKLGRIQKAEKVYRGISGGILPQKLWTANAWGVCCGGVEAGFLSTTCDSKAAMMHAAGDQSKAGTVLELQMSVAVRGASLKWISQYPHEEELCFAPLTGLQLLSTRVEKSVLVVEARVLVNLAPLTIEEVVTKRHRMVSQLCHELCAEVDGAMHREDGDWQAVAQTLFPKDATLPLQWGKALRETRLALRASMAEITRGEKEAMNDNETFVEAVRKAIEVKCRFETPSRKFIEPFLVQDPALELPDALARLCELACDNMAAAVLRADGGWREVKGAIFPEELDRDGWSWAASVQHLRHSMSLRLAADVAGAGGVAYGGKVVYSDKSFMDAFHKAVHVKRQFEQPPRLPAELDARESQYAVAMLQHKPKWLRLPCVRRLVGSVPDMTESSVQAALDLCPYLAEVCFGGCEKLTDSSVVRLAKGCPGLQHADFSDCLCLTDLAARHVAEGCRSLRSINLSGCVELSDDAAKHLAENCKSLLSVSLGGCSKLTDETAKYLSEGCRDLEVVSLCGCSSLTDATAAHLAEGCKGLQSLNLNGCESITDGAAKCLAASCRELRSINLGGCKRLTDEAVRHLAEGCGRLQDVNLGQCTNLTDSAAKHLAEGCKSLQVVTFFLCGNNLTDNAARHLAAGCKGLQSVSFECCWRVTGDARKVLQAAAPGCQVTLNE